MRRAVFQPRWTVFACPVECGHASGLHYVPAGEPVYLKRRAMYRCEAHADVAVDDDQVIDAELALQRERWDPLAEASAVRPKFDARRFARDVAARLQTPKPVAAARSVRVPRRKPRPLVPFRQLDEAVVRRQVHSVGKD